MALILKSDGLAVVHVLPRAHMRPVTGFNAAGRQYLQVWCRPGRRALAVFKTLECKIRRDVLGFKSKKSHTRVLKYLFRHFPPRLSVQNCELVLENCMGWRGVYRQPIPPTVSVQVQGVTVRLQSRDTEAICRASARFQKFYRKSRDWLRKDRRIFTDGLYQVAKF